MIRFSLKGLICISVEHGAWGCCECECGYEKDNYHMELRVFLAKSRDSEQVSKELCSSLTQKLIDYLTFDFTSFELPNTLLMGMGMELMCLYQRYDMHPYHN
jgi:hypothetical protein